MSTTVFDFIVSLNSQFANDYTDENILKWINDVELAVYEDLINEYATQYYNKIYGVSQYTLPTGCLWEDINGVWVDDELYKKRSVMHNNKNRSFFYANSKLNLYPAPSKNDVEYTTGAGNITFKAIDYESGESEITFAATTITTTGASFVTAGFVANMTIDITGCVDETGNNNRFLIESVTADVITIDGTLNAGAETGAISIRANCIYTAGSDFYGFEFEKTVLVSGCTDQTANNKYAVILAVADDVLTFAEGTFTAQAESGTVTIKQPNIKMIYKSRRTVKDIDDIETDTLLLPARFETVYEYYCITKICLLNREFAEANNFSLLYNQAFSELEKWYNANKEENHKVLLDSSWGLDYE